MNMKGQMLNKVINNGGHLFEGDYLYTRSNCCKCGEDFVLTEHDNPAHDGPRVLEFPDVCDECL